MAFIRCPQCNTVIEKPASGSPVCPNCGFGASPARKTAAKGAGAKTAAAPAATPPPAAWAPAPPAPAPMFSEPTGMPMQQRTSGKAIAALILGISALCIPVVGLITGILAVIFGILGVKEVDANPQSVKGKGMAITGIVLGALGFLGMLLWVILFGFAFSEIARCVEDPDAEGCEEYQATGDGGGERLVPSMFTAARLPGLDLARFAAAPTPAA